MKNKLYTFSILFVMAMMFVGFTPKNGMEPKINSLVETLSAKIQGNQIGTLPLVTPETFRSGIEQCAALWTSEDGDFQAFSQFVESNMALNQTDKQQLFEKLSYYLENFMGTADQLSVELLKPTTLTGYNPTGIDYLMGSYSPLAHFCDDMFKSKAAFITILNFPSYTLEQKNTKGEKWSRLEWAYARLGDIFTSRVPAEVNQKVAEAASASENYIASYNIKMGHILTEDGKRLFPEDMSLLSHWNLRDEIKSNYADSENASEKQEIIYKIMERIINQEIPGVVINNPDYDWYPYSNRVFKDGKEVAAEREQDVRYQKILNQFRAYRMEDPYHPNKPTQILRNFDSGMEVSSEEIEALFVKLLSGPEVQKVAKLIKDKLGRDLRPYDIWYDGFKSRSTLPEDKLTADTKRLYPDADAFNRDMPRLLENLGFDKEGANSIAGHITVEPATGSGHAWPCVARWEKARLRTRIGADGMDYKGYNIAIHEFGHNVEEVLSLYGIDHYMLAGIPNTAFTEAMAFIFQMRDLQLLGYGTHEIDANFKLDTFWGMYEIMGVSLVDMYLWRWLYANPEATAAELREQVVSIAKTVWNTYYAPVFGIKDSPILAVYSHTINSPMYLPNYPYGHIIQFQLEEHLANFTTPESFARELKRIYTLGRMTPNQWMQRAVGSPVSVDAVLTSVKNVIESK